MGKMVSKWIANDGEEFLSEQDMILHELEEIDKEEISVFVDNLKPSARKASEYKKLLAQWQRYLRETQLEPSSSDSNIDDDLIADLIAKNTDEDYDDEDESIRKSFEDAAFI